MSKYQPLSERLAASPGDEWPTTFGELESVLGFPLPKAARSGRGWWANDRARSHCRAWVAHGWEVGDVDHAAGRVVFRRGVAAGSAPASPLAEPSRQVEPAVKRLASETLPRRRGPGVAAAAAVTAGAALIAGFGALLVRGLLRRR